MLELRLFQVSVSLEILSKRTVPAPDQEKTLIMISISNSYNPLITFLQ